MRGGREKRLECESVTGKKREGGSDISYSLLGATRSM